MGIYLSKPTLYDEMLRKTLIAAVARAKKPGCKFDNACVIIGDQGARKSTFWSMLGGEFFSDALRDISGKDSLQVLSSACPACDFRFNLVRNIAPIFPPVNSSTSFASCGERLADIDAIRVVKSNPNASGDIVRPVENKHHKT